jgi:hypothetical protein
MLHNLGNSNEGYHYTKDVNNRTNYEVMVYFSLKINNCAMVHFIL